MAMSPNSEPGRSDAAGIPFWRRVLRRWKPAGEAATPPAQASGPPPGFDWRWYVSSYTDLAAAGISDEPSAIRHWREHGRREGRRFAPRRPNSFDWLSYVDRFPEKAPEIPAAAAERPTLVCPSVDSIFLRAWGD